MIHLNRLWVVFVFVISGIILAPYHSSLAATEQVSSFDQLQVDISMLSNSDMEITETQKYSFLTGTFRYGYRWIPLDGIESIDEIQVFEDGQPYLREPAVKRWIENYGKTGESPAGNYYAYYSWIEDNKLCIAWWYPETQGGSRTFEIKYVVHGGLWLHEDGDQLYWTAVFSGRDSAIGKAVVTVRLPEPLSSSQLVVDSHGVEAQSRIIDERTTEFTTGPVPGNGELSIRVIFPHGIVTTAPLPPEQQRGLIERFVQSIETTRQWIEDNPFAMNIINWCLLGLGATIVLGGALWFFTIQRKRASEPKIIPPSSYITNPPDDLPPALVGRLTNGAYGFLGDIFYLAQGGFLTITERIEERIYGNKREFLLERRHGQPPYLYQIQLMDILFQGKRYANLSENRHNWRQTVERTREALDYDGIRLGLLRRVNRETIRTTGPGARHLGKISLACAILGIIGLGISVIFQAGGAALINGGAILALGVASWHLTLVPARVKRTEEGALVATRWQEYWYHIWLAAQEKLTLTKGQDHLNTDLPYAVRFGLGKKLVRALTTMRRPSPVPYWFHPHLLHGEIKHPTDKLSILDIKRSFYRMLSEVRRALPEMARVGSPVMVASITVEEEAADRFSRSDD